MVLDFDKMPQLEYFQSTHEMDYINYDNRKMKHFAVSYRRIDENALTIVQNSEIVEMDVQGFQDKWDLQGYKRFFQVFNPSKSTLLLAERHHPRYKIEGTHIEIKGGFVVREANNPNIQDYRSELNEILETFHITLVTLDPEAPACYVKGYKDCYNPILEKFGLSELNC